MFTLQRLAQEISRFHTINIFTEKAGTRLTIENVGGSIRMMLRMRTEQVYQAAN